MTLGEKVSKVNPDMVVELSRKGDVFWIGRAKFVFGAVSLMAWRSTDIDVAELYYGGDEE